MEIYVKRYVQLLLEENKKQNLISRRAGLEEIEQHIQDSVEVLKWVSLTDMKVIDIGSGAGFPGLILAMVCPGSEVSLVESDLKKSVFLQHACDELGLKNVKVIRDRVENLGHESGYRDSYDICTSRAVAAMRVVLEYGIPLVMPEGRVLLWKGSGYQQEIAESQMALEVLGGKVEEVHLYNLLHERDRAIVTVRKVRPTPQQFPRRIGAPTKKPL